MPYPIASKTRLQIRQAIGYNIGDIIVSTWSANGTATTGLDTVELSRFADDELKGAHIQFNTAAVTEYGYKRWVSDFASSTSTVTFTTIGAGEAPASGESYELWRHHDINDINSKISNAEIELTPHVFMDKESHAVGTQEDVQQYGIPSGFSHIYGVSYCNQNGNEQEIDDCDSVWTAGSNVTASLDTTMEREGSGCAKLVVAAAAAAGAILGYRDITSVDLSDMTDVEVWIYSTTALTSGYLQYILSATATCGSTTEAIDIPAIAAKTWTRCVLTLANPLSDTAIISHGIKMVTDVGAFTMCVDYALGVQGNTREWQPLIDKHHWYIQRGSTAYLMLTHEAIALTGANRLLRIEGYQQITVMSADTSTPEIDPQFIINRVSEWLSEGTTRERFRLAAELAKAKNSTSLRPGTVRI